MLGSKKTTERILLINKSKKIIFNSEWTKKRFLNDLNKFYVKSEKLQVIHQCTNKTKINLNIKKNIITFVGKLNSAKGYDIFCKSIVKILNKYPNWKAVVIGDEPREKIFVKHQNLQLLGFQPHNKVLDLFNKASIAVTCSRWDEPFGRTSLEAASRGCAVIISNRGGLPETVTNCEMLRIPNATNLYKTIEKLITKKKYRLNLQTKSIKNFYLTNEYISKKIDNYRNKLLQKTIIKKPNSYNEKYKILHVTNFNERHNGRLFYNTGRRLNNGFIRLKHSVLTLSDRDIVSYYRSIKDFDGSKTLNNKLTEVISNYLPDIIILGHADLIKKETLHFIKKNYPNIKIVQWFLDRMDSEWKNNRSRFLDKMNLMDCNFCTTSPDVLKFPKKYKVFYIPNPADESLENLKIYNNKYFINDIFFAMSHGVHRGTLKKGKIDRRENFINKLIKKIPNIKFDLYGMNNIQPIWADNFKKIISNSKMALNLSQGISTKFYSSDRITQLVGNGLLTFIDKKTKLNKFFSDDEIIFYNSINDLAKKIVKYSENDKLRRKIAKKGRDRYLNNFNSTKVAEFILKKTFNIRYKKKFAWEN
jgi:glycosyltransferase involved in cell wall biosynthesis